MTPEKAKKPNPPEPDRCLTPQEVAAVINTTLGTLARWRSERTGPPFFKLQPGRSGSVRYPLSSLNEWLQQRVRASKGDL
jgi:predicted DNA-binding transcriptional regulator AlpA